MSTTDHRAAARVFNTPTLERMLATVDSHPAASFENLEWLRARARAIRAELAIRKIRNHENLQR